MQPNTFLHRHDTIVALSTPPGVGALGVVRLSGAEAIAIAARFFSLPLRQSPSHSARVGLWQRASGQTLDEVVLTLYRAPRSFTKEDTVEISCHGSPFILQQLIQDCLEAGARLATPGEFTQRAYLNGRMDLAQAEAVADLIASESEAAHRMAIQQLRGGFSQKIRDLREEFVRLAALLELELDFAEEDVEFADRALFQEQVAHLETALREMADSFALGNALKNGVPVAIVGKPNAGKSTLLNALLEEEKAIVSNIPGTTRDTIEDEKVIQGIRFRFIDTAGLRETDDLIEKIGVERAKAKIQTARMILYLYDAQTEAQTEAIAQAQALQAERPDAYLLLLANKVDAFARFDLFLPEGLDGLAISALERRGLEQLTNRLYQQVQAAQTQDVLVSNMRHYESLQNTRQALQRVAASLESGLSTEMVASDVREALYHLGYITGEVSNEDLLDHIFSKFCIGK
ncbi:MAG: tRNA uridine-5-carboxymethylaminomethyl(34) synthesis GTPase MnmE [Microscillaceae bacterium]|nr:tRNA uridine-5-carboxymethylaminomethyl(34) synthesis GTPase MnmE [Microscillaceae bacterium]